MNVVTLLSKFAVTVVGCALLALSLSVHAETPSLLDTAGRFDLNGLGNVNSNPIPLLSITLTASTDLMKGNAMDLVASYRGVGLNQDRATLHYHEVSHGFSVHTPRLKSLDFSHAIREKVETSPEKMLDRMIIDGALGFNLYW